MSLSLYLFCANCLTNCQYNFFCLGNEQNIQLQKYIYLLSMGDNSHALSAPFDVISSAVNVQMTVLQGRPYLNTADESHFNIHRSFFFVSDVKRFNPLTPFSKKYKQYRPQTSLLLC